MSLNPPILKGSRVQLESLNESHQKELYEAAQNEAIWTYTPTRAVGDKFYQWFDKAMKGLQAGKQLPFAVRRMSDQKLIGSTRYYDIYNEHLRLAIGYTWYVPEVWGSYVNPECKYLLLKYAFEELKINRIEFNIDARHAHSRAAIKKLGATEEGILRCHMILEDGFIRDTVMLSIIQSEWPSVKLNLEMRLQDYK